ncbi:unnamed protein product [Rhizophagus irregularis]|nr:unnamed protein product [Rhizophagus irregularis]
MEGVENTSSKGEASTASPQQPMAMDIVNDNTTNKQGLDSSVHAKNTDKEQTVDQENDNIGWRTVGKLNKIKLFFPLNNVPGNNDNEKRSYMYNKVVGLISFKHQSYSLVTVYGNKMFHIVVDDEETATQVKNLQIVDNHTDRFMSHDQLPKQSMAQGYTIKIWDVPLDIIKDDFAVYIRNLGDVKDIKFAVKQLYYEVTVIFNNNNLENHFKETWCLRYGKMLFRSFPTTLSRDERNMRFQWALKLVNLPQGTFAHDINDILVATKAKSCFIPKSRFSKNYEKERFAWFYFDSALSMEEARKMKFSFKGKGLIFVDYNTITCHVCGSPSHRYRRCPEDRKIKEKAHRLNAYNEIYNRFGVKAPKPRLGFVPLNESFNTQLHYHPNHVISGQSDDWDLDLWDQPQQYSPDMTRSYASVVNKNQKPVNNSKGKQKVTLTNPSPQNTLVSGSNVNSQQISVSPKTVEERLTWLENQMVKFTTIMQKLADRVTTLEKTHVHTHNSPIFSTPTNVTPPVNTQFTSKSTQFINNDVNIKKRKIAAPAKKNTNLPPSNISTTIVNTQTRGPSPVEIEQMEEVIINNSLDEPTISNSNINMPSSSSSIDSRLTSFEKNMEQAFGKLDAVTKFLDSTSNTLPYINNNNNNTFNATLNVAGMNTSSKQQQILNYMKINKINILTLTETKLKTNSANILYKKDDVHSWWECDDNNHFSNGVGIIMDNTIAKHVQIVKGYFGRLLHVKLFVKGNVRLSILVIYNYANNTEKENTLELYKEIERIIKEELKFNARIVISGDFNVNFDIYHSNLLFHDKPLNTWRRNDSASRIDYIWVHYNIIPDLVYASTNKPHIIQTDHSTIATYFSLIDIFNKTALATKKRHNNAKMINYEKVTDDHWLQFNEEIENNNGKLDLENLPQKQKTLNKVWNLIRDTFLVTMKNLPMKKQNPNREDLPETVLYYKAYLRKLSKILLNITEKQIVRNGLANEEKKRKFIKDNLNIITPLLNEFPIGNNSKPLIYISLVEFKQLVKDLFRLVQAKYIEEDQIYKQEKIKFYVERRLEDLQNNKSRMIDSILERKRKTIILDRLLIERDGVQSLCLDDKEIVKEAENHYQNVAGKRSNNFLVLDDRWSNRYKPIQQIDQMWYSEILIPISIEEWRDMINSLPNDKASGPSKISNEMLKKAGDNTHKNLLFLANLCLTTGDIPSEWRTALLYPIPKTMEWEYTLTKTRPIILLETP